jgi:hypothetical protein
VSKLGRGQKALGGAEAPPLNDVACFVVISISGVLFLFGSPVPFSYRIQESLLRWEQRANGFLWSLIYHRSFDPTSSGAAYAVFVVLSLVVGQNPIWHFLSKRIS